MTQQITATLEDGVASEPAVTQEPAVAQEPAVTQEPRTSRKPTVLFLCQHNAGRSQLGAGLLEVLAGDRFTAASAGLSPADTVNPAIAATVAELGLDISDRVPRAVTAEDLASADIVVAMKPGLALPAAPAGRLLEWRFPDPTDWSAESVRPLREAVAARIRSELLQGS